MISTNRRQWAEDGEEANKSFFNGNISRAIPAPQSTLSKPGKTRYQDRIFFPSLAVVSGWPFFFFFSKNSFYVFTEPLQIHSSTQWMFTWIWQAENSWLFPNEWNMRPYVSTFKQFWTRGIILSVLCWNCTLNTQRIWAIPEIQPPTPFSKALFP